MMPGGISGSDIGIITDDHGPQIDVASGSELHAVLMTIVPPCDDALSQAAGGRSISPAFTVQPFRATQHAVVPQTPTPPVGNWSATLTLAGSVPSGSVTTQFVESTIAGFADSKQVATGKQPLLPASVPVPGVSGFTAADLHAPFTHVLPSGHVEATPPSPTARAVPTHR
jgi:hypothetical protein